MAAPASNGAVFDTQGRPRGPEIRVHGEMLDFQGNASMTALPGGGFIVAWTGDTDGDDIDETDAFVRKLDATGQPAGPERLVNTEATVDRQGVGDVLHLGEGRTLVTYRSFDPANSDFPFEFFGIKGRVYGPDGAPEGPPVFLSELVYEDAGRARLAALGTEAVVAVWSGEFDDEDVFARVLDNPVSTDGGLGAGLSPVEACLVAYLYEAGLDRDGAIDLAGLNFWIDQREAGLTERDLALEPLRSPEFEAAVGEALDEGDPAYPGDGALVRALYENVLDREADALGLAFWNAVLARPGFDRADLLLAFAAREENVAGSPAVATLAETAPGEWTLGRPTLRAAARAAALAPRPAPTP